MIVTILGASGAGEGGAAAMYWAGVRDAAKHPTMHKAAPPPPMACPTHTVSVVFENPCASLWTSQGVSVLSWTLELIVS